MRVRLPGTIFPTFFLPFALVFCFAAGPGFVQAADVHLDEMHSEFYPGTQLTLRHGERRYRVSLRIGGAHTPFNATAAAAVLVAAGADLETGLARMEQLYGRVIT